MLSAEAGHSYEIRGEMAKVSFLQPLVQPITCKAHWRYAVVDHQAVPAAEPLTSGDLPATRSTPLMVFPVPNIRP